MEGSNTLFSFLSTKFKQLKTKFYRFTHDKQSFTHSEIKTIPKKLIFKLFCLAFGCFLVIFLVAF